MAIIASGVVFIGVIKHLDDLKPIQAILPFSAGGPADDFQRDIAVDAQGNVYLTAEDGVGGRSEARSRRG